VHKILRQVNLKPHRVGTFSRSPDPDFAAKVVNVVGLYVHPPEHGVVLCVDEKTQVQALDRRQPLLPMRPGQIERRTHDYKRNGTVQLYAALQVHAGQVISRSEERHRSREFIAFMNHLLRAYLSGEIHVILDNIKHTRLQRGARVAQAPLKHASRLPLHSHLFLVAQPGRSAVQSVAGQGPSQRSVSHRKGLANSYHGLHTKAQRGRALFPLGEERPSDN
jgi:hypothetical protein